MSLRAGEKFPTATTITQCVACRSGDSDPNMVAVAEYERSISQGHPGQPPKGAIISRFAGVCSMCGAASLLTASTESAK